jgi:hypothetical protein
LGPTLWVLWLGLNCEIRLSRLRLRHLLEFSLHSPALEDIWAAAVIAVFHDVLVTLGFFSIFQWEVSLTVIASF